MKLGLLGYPLEHTLSPSLYEKFLAQELISYELFPFEKAEDIPELKYFRSKLDGLNITSPYKTHFVPQIEILSPIVKNIGAVNTLAFSESKVIGTNTDVLAVFEIMKRYQNSFKNLKILLLGDGTMAKVTNLVARELKIPLVQFSRKSTPDFHSLDLKLFNKADVQNLIINSCSRSFVFSGKLTGSEIFWDYNYSFLPHQNTLPSQVKAYHDGREMLELQAKEAIKFWKEVNPKLK